MAARSAPTTRPVPARPAVPLITLHDGLLIESGGRTIVHVDVADHSVVLHLPGREALAFGLSTGGLDDAARTVATVAQRAIGRRRAGDPPTSAAGPRQGHLFGGAGDADIDLVAAASDDRLQPLLRDAILDRARVVARRREPRIDDVAARVQALVATPIVYSAAVLDTPWLVDDVLRFKAAAVAVAMAETLPPPVRAAAGVRALIPLLSRWRTLFARDGVLTRSVQRSLTLLDDPAFAGAVVDDAGTRDVWCLRQVTLVQPLRSARHLRLLSERQRLGGATLERDLRFLQLADDDAIDEAIDEVVLALRLRRLGARQREHVLAEVLGQAEARDGDDRLPAAQAVRTLVRRRLEAVREARRRLPKVRGVAPTAVAPPIPLPVDPRLRFLVSEEDFLDEGERMHHCVGTYFSSAAAGEGWFFHYEDDDGPATVRVGVSGAVEEAQGVCNVWTPSARRAATLLSAWGLPLSVLALSDKDAVLWQGDGPPLDDGQRPLRTLAALAQAIALELDGGAVRDVVIYLDLVRAAAERALRGQAWLFFEDDRRRIVARRADDPSDDGDADGAD